MVSRTLEIGENIIYKNKTIRFILIYLNKKVVSYASDIAREVKIESCSVVNNFKIIIDKGLVEQIDNVRQKYPRKLPSKRTKYFKLTEKGKTISKLLLEIDEVLNQNDR